MTHSLSLSPDLASGHPRSHQTLHCSLALQQPSCQSFQQDKLQHQTILMSWCLVYIYVTPNICDRSALHGEPPNYYDVILFLPLAEPPNRHPVVVSATVLYKARNNSILN